MFVDVWQCIPHLEWDVVLHEPFHKKARLHIGAIKHRNVRIGIAHPHIILNFLDDHAGLGLGIGKTRGGHRLSCASCRPDFFVKPGLVVADQFSCVIHNIRGGAVVYPQKRLFCPGIVFLKAQHDLRLRAAKPVDGLVIIAHNKQIVPGRCQHPDYLILYPVDVLKFIDQDVLVLILPRRQDVLALGEQLVTEYQHVIEIQKSFVHHGLLVALVQLFEQFFRAVLGIVVIQVHHLAFYQADLGKDLGCKFRLILHIHLKLVHQFPDNPGTLLILGDIRRVIAVGPL